MSGRWESNPVYMVPNHAYCQYTTPRGCSQSIDKPGIITSMNSGITLPLIILAVLAGSLWYIVKAEGGYTEIPRLLLRVGIDVSMFEVPDWKPIFIKQEKQEESSSEVPAIFQSGKSRYSQGSCGEPSDCYQSGCSEEVCSSVVGIVSTCEYSESFPNVQGYSCTCLPTGVCGWE